MSKKRASSEGGQTVSKRLRTGENSVGNISDMSSDRECDGENDCSQNVDFRPQEHNSESENGIIEEITLQNFMCHSHLRVVLSPNVNFIIGRNGSGKSAIMTAIVVGLGGKAANTNRGSSLKGFVKDKCSTAVINIKLKNCGQDAFKPQEYGSHITIERRISSDGVGSYKISNEKGNIVSTKKAELNHILDQFNIQIDNPVSILNQDTSRNFLYASDPGKKYKFFLKATQLEQMNNDCLTMQEQLKIMSITLEKKKETISEMENEVHQLEEKYRDLEQLKVLEGKIEGLKKEIPWAQVIEKEKNAAKMAAEHCERVQTRRTVKSLKSEISQTERRLRAEQQTRGQIEEITKQFSDAKERLNHVNASMKCMATLCKKLVKMVEEHVHSYSMYRKLIALRANLHFQMMLSQRGFTGRMKCKHKEEELHLLVDVDQASQGGSKSTKSLSGGERSFSTVSFIMALWDAMEAPFRCLDEFDVFMDMVDRRISMDSFMKVAKEQRHRQFILFTPQDMSNVEQTDQIRIFKLQDPERG